MEEELEIIEAYGFATSKEVADILHKNIRAVIRKLNILVKWKKIEILDFFEGRGGRRLYVGREILNAECIVKAPQH